MPNPQLLEEQRRFAAAFVGPAGGFVLMRLPANRQLPLKQTAATTQPSPLDEIPLPAPGESVPDFASANDEALASSSANHSGKDEPLVSCEHCGKQVARSRVDAHRRACRKVLEHTPRTYNSALHRRPLTEGELDIPSGTTGPKKSTWREKSAQLTYALKGPRDDVSPPPDPRLPCPHCSRKFDPNSLDRHAAICKPKK